MTVPVLFHDWYVADDLAAAFAAACGHAAMSPEREQELLRQTIALCDAAVKLAPTYPLPPDDAPLRPLLASAITALRAEFYPFDRDDSLDDIVHRNHIWIAMRRYATARLATLEA